MSRREDGQVMVAGVGVALLLIAAALVLVHLAAIRSQGGHAQTAADVAALAAAKVLAQDPAASPSEAIKAAGAAAKANGAHLRRFQVDSASGVPTAVDVQVSETASGDVPGVGQRNDVVLLTSRAGVVYPAAPRPGTPLPLNLAGTSGGAAVVRAAEAQIGWPYVWGGESRGEGGFDCSGLVDYAYAAAGRPLGGRPTSESLWAMAQHIPEVDLEPGDLVFLGAPSGQPYHVGIYAGDGMAVVAPHTGAFVELEPLTADPWDGFGRLIKGNSAGAPVEIGSTEDLARKYNVPPTVLEAAEQVGVKYIPLDLAQRLSVAMRANGGNVVDALAQVLGSRQAAGAVMAAIASPAAATTSSVDLLPRMAIRWRGPGSGGFRWSSSTDLAEAATGYSNKLDQVDPEGEMSPSERFRGLSPEGHLTGVGGIALVVLQLLPVRNGVHVAAELTASALSLVSPALKLIKNAPKILGSGAEASGPLRLLLRRSPWAFVIIGLGTSVIAFMRAKRWGGANGRWINAASAASYVVLAGDEMGIQNPWLTFAAVLTLAGIAVIQNWNTVKRWAGIGWNTATHVAGWWWNGQKTMARTTVRGVESVGSAISHGFSSAKNTVFSAVGL